MLTGKYYHSLDTKGRLIIPSKLKEQLGDRITILKESGKKDSPNREMGRCLSMYSEEEWKSYTAKLKEIPKSQAKELVRFLYSNAIEVQPDSQGRILLPAEMIGYAGITKNIVTAGCGNYAEIWSEERWNAGEEQVDPEEIEDMLAELGM